MSLDPRVDIGHVHLKVADIDRSLAFYRDILGFDVMQRIGDEAAFISAGGYHHHLGLNTWESRGGSPPPPNTTGLYHVAIRYPDRAQLGNALKRLVEANWPIDGATDHGVSEAIYLRDPDGNGIELYRDRAEPEWPRPSDGGPADDQRAARPAGAAERGGLMAKGYAEGPAAEEAERRLEELERGGGGAPSRSCARRSTARPRTSPSGTSSAGATSVDPDELFASGKAWGITVVRATV